MTKRIIASKTFSHILDGFVPFLTWFIITLPLWLSPFHPALVAYFIIAFDIYFLFKAIQTAYLASLSYRKIMLGLKIPYAKKLKERKSAKDIHHFIIIPNFKEPLYKLESTIQRITQSDYPFKKLFLVLAFEKREEKAQEKLSILQKKFGNHFCDVIATHHELLPNEAPGKASNQTYAAKAVDTYVETHSIDQKNALITICDADSHFSTNYFSYLTNEFLKDKGRLYHFYWAPVFLYNNFWQLPFIIRIQATLSSVLRLAFLSQKENLIQISTYSTNLWLLKQIGFWDVDIIPEDWHIYLQAFFMFGDRVKTIPLYTIVNGDAVYSGGFIKTLKNRYEQEKRWAWGVSDIGYSLKKLFTTPNIPLIPKLKKILFISENHLLWPTSFFVLTISASIPPIINPVFKRTVLGFLLPQMAGLILTMASLMLVLYTYLDIRIRQQVKQKTTFLAIPFLFVQWYLLPIISFFFSSLPSLEAHTRLLLRKDIKYEVTEKV
jgi:hypothetical protein